MAALSTQFPTLLDLAKISDPDGKIATVVEILNQENAILEDMVWLEGNLPTGHRTTIRTGIPAPTWRKLYSGVQPNKSTTIQVTDNCGMLEAYAEVDKALADLNGNSAQWRLSEDRAHIEGMYQELASTLIFGNDSVDEAEFTGLAARFNSTTAANAENIIVGGSAGGQTDNNSIWLVAWGPNTVHGIIPKGSKAGLQVTDKGQVTIEDASGGSNTGRMEAYRTHYRWDCGLSVRDWRYVVRIPNIDKSLLATSVGSGADLPDLMYQAMRRLPSMGLGKPVFYMSRDMLTMLQRQLSYKTKDSSLMVENVGGVLTDKFHGIPIRRVDVLAADEARVA